jgi:hypothetical protein
LERVATTPFLLNLANPAGNAGLFLGVITLDVRILFYTAMCARFSMKPSREDRAHRFIWGPGDLDDSMFRFG